MFVVQNKTLFLTNTANYNLDTRQRKQFMPSSSKLNHLSKRSLLFGDKNF